MKLHRFTQAAFAVLAALALVTSPARAQTPVTGFSDLNYWGTGTNHSALVIAWNDGKASGTIAWGFSWNGSATVADMLTALAAADPRLFARIDSATGFGLGVFGLGYDTNGSGAFAVTGAVDINGNPTTPVFVSGVANLDTDPATTQAPKSSTAAAPADSADHYVEGWKNNGFWEFYSGPVGAAYPATWDSNFDGASGTTLVNNGWFAFSITTPDFDSNIPGAAVAAAVPEPGTVALFGIGAFVILLHVKRRIHTA